MTTTLRQLLLLAVILLATSAPLHAQTTPDWVTQTPNLTEITPFEAENRLLDSLPTRPGVAVTTAGRSVENRPIRVVHFHRPADTLPTAANPSPARPFTILLIGLQHGDEPAGREALLTLITDLTNHPDRLPPNTDLWILPTANPDGLVNNTRRNANNVDLNRDHQILSQPETQTLHRLARTLTPDLIVDAHEFRRDTSDYTNQGWLEWPLIMLDTANHPLLPLPVYTHGLQLIESAKPLMQTHAVNYARYLIGDAPPQGELRFSTLDPDDARNGLAFHAGLSFIIESGIYRQHPNPQHNLTERTRAYRLLFHHLITAHTRHPNLIPQIRAAANQPLPNTIPTNTLWAEALPESPDATPPATPTIPVIDQATGETLNVPAPGFRTTRVIKQRVQTPRTYLIPAQHAPAYRQLLDHHAIPYTIHPTPADPPHHLIEAVRLITVSTNYDNLYHRYDGLQQTQVLTPTPSHTELGLDQPGALRIDLRTMTPRDARRTIAILEPRMAFGLYQWPTYRQAINPQTNLIPVYRILPE
ncbi:M14 family zinc carboxypeptidase [Mucisphaera sp.]|uniref:M14 family zinc carboxypeptidase n=1 Tax=Mucisphaera sp. TaxID=2913024 RepID=UPI003D0FF4C1